mmetsp:Transcript_2604/g.7280  ORF Transcript_2604/g.7280 Transcript_2604/m.7280 type:complete len:214 (+) Transcript_2604:390-1031(+)
MASAAAVAALPPAPVAAAVAAAAVGPVTAEARAPTAAEGPAATAAKGGAAAEGAAATAPAPASHPERAARGRGRSRAGRHALHFWRDLLVGPPHHLNDAAQRMCVTLSDQRHSVAFLASAARTANAVNVVLGLRRQIVVHNECDAPDVEAASGHIGGDEKLDLGSLQVVECLLPLALTLIAVDGGTWDPIASEVACNLVAHALGATEDDCLGS